MKKIFKGCLIAILSLFGLVLLIGLGIYIYSKTPNDIDVCENPIHYRDIKEDLDFPGGEIPPFIREADSHNIVYQTTINNYDWVNHSVYICVIKPNAPILPLEHKLPVKDNDLEEINLLLISGNLTNPFTPAIALPDNMETRPGYQVKVFNPHFQEKLNLNSGSYQFLKSAEIDKEGYYTEVIVYDEISNLLYYERMRFHAFQ
jgi:hypothetical protein